MHCGDPGALWRTQEIPCVEQDKDKGVVDISGKLAARSKVGTAVL